MDAHELLVKARNRLERDGWMRGCFLEPEGTRVCSWGAICYETPLHSGVDCPREYDEAVATLGGVVGVDKAAAIAVWNDTPGRTKEQVLAAFDEAIRRTAPAPDFDALQVRLDEVSV